MKIRSAKAKGRRLAERVAELLTRYAPDLRTGDISVTPASVNGPDLLLSPAAREIYPFHPECKNQEKLNVWDALKQAETTCAVDCLPVVFFSRNHAKDYVALEAESFIKLMR